MANSKIIYFGETLIDLTQDTVEPSKMLEGTTAHGADGEPITGTMKKFESMEHTWDQIPVLVKNYLDNVTYDPSDYTVSSIADYAPSTADKSNTYPIGKTIEVENGLLGRKGYALEVSGGNVTVYNDIPNEYTEYTVRNNGTILNVGTLKPTGFLRQIKCDTSNVRDLGGWTCDGGTVKYGKLFRGGEFQTADLDIFLNQLGIRHELNLRGTTEAEENVTVLRDYVGYTCPENYVWYTITDTYNETWYEILRCIFDCATKNKPLYFHCSAGADRAGTVACIIEAILGVSQSDIDKDYELTCFSTGTNTDNNARRRNESEWKGLIAQINSLSNGSTFRDKVLNWGVSLGFTVDEINTFRKAMVDGTPDVIVLNSTIPITWLSGKTCGYSVGSTCVVSDGNGYFISDEINVEYGKTYELNCIISISSSIKTSIKFVGINDAGIVTELQSLDVLSGDNTLQWTPTIETTTKLRLRGYTDYGTEIMNTTELVVL